LKKPIFTPDPSIRGVTDTAGTALPDTYIRFTTAGKKDSLKDDQTFKASTNKLPDPVIDELPPLKAAQGVTALAGRALMLDGKPLVGVTLRIDQATATTDGTGRFLLTNVTAGHHEMVIDGRTAHRPNETYGVFEVGVNLVGGQTTVLEYTVWMPALDTAHAVKVPFPTASEVVVTKPLLPGLEFHIPPNTTITDSDGKTATEISITPIPT